MRDFFRTLPRNVLACFEGVNLLWHTAAIAITVAVVYSGLDWAYFVGTRGLAWSPFVVPALVAGSFLPIAIPIALFGLARIRKDTRLAFAGWAIGQAAAIGWIVSSLYKAFTGRIQPPLGALVDTSHGFNLGFWQNGIFWGWPSSHTTVAFAMAFAILCLYPKSKILRCVALAYACYVGFSVSVDIHWLSEALAGAIFGAVVGTVVGKSKAALTR